MTALEPCNGLKAGMVVKDRGGIRKVVTRIAAAHVYWQFLEPRLQREHPGEHSTAYARFADTHFVTAEIAPIPKAA